MVVFSLQAGLLLSIALAVLIDPISGASSLTRALLASCMFHPVIVGPRLIYRFIDELALWSRLPAEETVDPERVLFYGAGIRTRLFIKAPAARNGKINNNPNIGGLLDDESGFKDLQTIITHHQINQIIIPADLKSETRAALEAFCTGKKIRLTEWRNS